MMTDTMTDAQAEKTDDRPPTWVAVVVFLVMAAGTAWLILPPWIRYEERIQAEKNAAAWERINTERGFSIAADDDSEVRLRADRTDVVYVYADGGVVKGLPADGPVPDTYSHSEVVPLGDTQAVAWGDPLELIVFVNGHGAEWHFFGDDADAVSAFIEHVEITMVDGGASG